MRLRSTPAGVLASLLLLPILCQCGLLPVEEVDFEFQKSPCYVDIEIVNVLSGFRGSDLAVYACLEVDVDQTQIAETGKEIHSERSVTESYAKNDVAMYRGARFIAATLTNWDGDVCCAVQLFDPSRTQPYILNNWEITVFDGIAYEELPASGAASLSLTANSRCYYRITMEGGTPYLLDIEVTNGSLDYDYAPEPSGLSLDYYSSTVTGSCSLGFQPGEDTVTYFAFGPTDGYTATASLTLKALVYEELPVTGAVSLDFLENRRYYCKVTMDGGNLYQLDIAVTAGSLDYDCDSDPSGLSLDYYAYTLTGSHSLNFQPDEDTVTYFAFAPTDGYDGATASLALDVIASIDVGGVITCLKFGNEADTVYGIDGTAGRLLAFDTATRSIARETATPHADPVRMAVSLPDDEIYVLYSNTSVVSVFDAATASFADHVYTSTATHQDIAVSPTNRRIYILSSGELLCLDMDAFTEVFRQAVDGASMAIDEAGQKVLTGERSYSPSSLYRYSVAVDTLTLEEELRDAGGNGRRVTLSPDASVLVFPCGGGNGAGYTLFAFDASDFTNVLGEWDIGTYPMAAEFSPDGSLLYGSNGDPHDDYLYVMDGATFGLIRKVVFPNSSDYAVFSPNSAGSCVVAFSYDWYYDSDYRIYFYDNVRK